MAPRLLLVEDDLDYAFAVGRMLRDAWDDAVPDHVQRLADAVRLLQERSYDCVLLDLGLPDGAGIDVLAVVHRAAAEVPVVVLTADGSDEDGEEALRNGAQDYLLKDRVKSGDLHRSIRYAIERSAAAAAVRRSGERLQLLLEGISDVIVVLAPDGTVPYISPSVRRVLGHDPGRLASSVRSRLVHPDDVAAVKQRIRELLAGTALGEALLFRFLHGDGSWRVLEAVASTTVDDPDLSGLVITLRDVTERDRAQQEVGARVAQQAMLAELGRNALHDLGTDALLGQAAHGVAATFDIEHGLAFEWDAEAEALMVRGAAGPVPASVATTRVTAADLADVNRLGAALRSAGLEMSSCLAAVIEGRDRPYGVFVTGSHEPRRFSPDDVHFVQSVANLLAVAVERRRTEEEIRYRALHDALTGLPNRTMLADRMSVALADIGRTGDEVALLLMDLDGFKEINDTLGHDVGDRMLCEVARRLTGVVRATDTVARLGGDEFAVLCTHLAAEEATGVATKILGALRPPCFIDGVVLQVQGSIGLAFAPRHGADGSMLLKRADTAMYRAKRGGTGLSVYTDDIDEPRRTTPPTAAELARAIEGDELVLHYQPTIEVATGRVAGVEALVRWRHPARGLLAPDRFIPLAEEADLIGPLTDWVLGHALAEARRWREQGHETPVSVNLSPRTLHDPAFVGVVQAALARSGVPASLLELEVSEAAVLGSPSAALAVVSALWAVGVRVSIDDVGTGYPSPAYLKHLPVADLKVDGEFVRGMATDEHAERVVRSVIELAHDLSLRAVAEGVESAAVLRRLGELGCDYAQGFHMSQPVDAAQVGLLLESVGRTS